jgi:hypothetical protein
MRRFLSARRYFSSGVVPAEQAARLRAMSEAVNRNVVQGKEALAEVFGASHTESLWASEYYRHGQHKFTVPALSLACEAAEKAGSPALVAKHAVFYAALLDGLSGDDFSAYSNQLPAVEGMRLGTLVDVLGGVGGVQGKAVFARLCASLEARGGQEAAAMVAHARAVPRRPVHEWPFPHLAPLEAPSGGGDIGGSSAMEAWKPPAGEAPHPFEVTGLSPRLREACDGPTWLLHAATTVLECQWGAFYATGSASPLQRILEATLPWASTGASSLPDAPAYLIDLEKRMPEHLHFSHGKSPPDTLRAIRAAVARAAQWSLLMHSRRHPAVVRAVAKACSDLAPYLAEPSARGAEGTLPPLTEQELRDRLEVWPPLLHLMARGRLDAPFKEGDASP